MAVREIQTMVLPQNAFNVQTISTDTTTDGNIIDTAAFDGGILFVIQAGTVSAGNVTPLLEESDNSNFSSESAIPDSNIIYGTLTSGQEAAAIINTTGQVKSIGVVGTKRYVRLALVSASSANLIVGATVLKVAEIQSAT